MNIESANLSSVVPGSGTVESMSPMSPILSPLTDGDVSSEGFSTALVAQIELLSNIKTEGSLPLQTSAPVALQNVSGLQGVAGLPAGKIDTQDFAALLGNDLPASYQTKDDVDHEAALAAVTDTLKYISQGTTAGEKAVMAEQNMKDVIAMAVPVQQNMKDVVAVAVPAEQNVQYAAEKAVPAEQNTTDVAAEADQSVNNVIAMNAPVQMDLEQGNDKPDKKPVEGEAQIAPVEDNRGAEELLATIILPSVIPAEQEKPVNNLTPAPVDTIKENGLLSFIKPSTGDAKPNQAAKVSDDVLQNKTAFRQPEQGKQDFNWKYFENARQAEKTVADERQVLNIDGEKTLPRVGADISQLNKPVVDNKIELPAMTKPLSHPEWNKDLGERIVWMNSRAIPSAEIRLNPQHLGPISVRVDVTDDQATVVFTAQHAVVRETLEASIPKLREMMGAQQLNLVEVNVSQGPSSEQGRSQSQNFAQNFADGRGQAAVGAVVDGVDDVEQEIESGRAIVSKGVLSIYA